MAVGAWFNDETTSNVPIRDWMVAHAEERWQEIVLDPTFWQTLGKALGWGEADTGLDDQMFFWMPEWKRNAHEFYDLILTDQPTDKFWDEILSTNEKE